ncbi:MAG TPA: aminoacyl-histidine dipeptidase [Candidatus Alistipes merdigallinarum]|nr:aminoacyl-histidine dipeptidase [Candidatus Alistipes merdigallinarum]
MSDITSLVPTSVWMFFDRITKIPRPSKKEERMIAYLVEFAKNAGLEYHKDGAGNVLIRKPACHGYEERPVVILQSHMDMVCEKNSEVNFDFEKDPIRVRIEEGWVKADGTTLGADCGIGMAAQLAVLAAKDIPHGPIECLFTVDEETGLTGAFELSDDLLSGKYLINLDSEDEGQIFIGCAGGIDTLADFQYEREDLPKNYEFYRVDVSGLIGGHSGDDIDKGRANSNKILARWLDPLTDQFDMRLVYFDGGNLRNAIPREAYAVFGVPVREADRMKKLFEKFVRDLQNEFGKTEMGMKITLSEIPVSDKVIDLKTQQGLLDALLGVPNGVLAMSRTMPGMVETSTNLASVKFVGELLIEVATSQRSEIESARNNAAASVEAVFRLAGAEVVHSDGYPGWTPDPDSYLTQTTRRVYRTLFGHDPVVRSIHAGLECGLFLQKYPNLQMVSFGPTLRGVHSPDERLEIASVEKFWKLLVALLQEIR